jgi:hypothetical protein
LAKERRSRRAQLDSNAWFSPVANRRVAEEPNHDSNAACPKRLLQSPQAASFTTELCVGGASEFKRPRSDHEKRYPTAAALVTERETERFVNGSIVKQSFALRY